MWGKIFKNFWYLHPTQALQSLSTYHIHCIQYSEFMPLTKKVCSSDLMHCQISIFEIKMMEKIGINIMPFSNPMSHRYWANPFPYLGTWICTREPGSVLGNLDLNKSLVWDLYLGTWTRTRLCAQKLAQYWWPSQRYELTKGLLRVS